MTKTVNQDKVMARWKQLNERVKRYKQLSQNKSGRRTAKTERYEALWAKGVSDLAELEKQIQAYTKKQEKKQKVENKKIVKKIEQTVEENKKEIVKHEKKVNDDLKDVYCGARKPRKDKRLGNEAECRQKGQIRLYGKHKVGGKVTGKMVDEMFNVQPIQRPVRGRKKGGKLPAGMISKFIKASRDKDFYDVGDFKIDRDLSHEWVKVYHNPKNNQALVFHRGSADASDAWTDVKLLFQQKNNNRFKTSERVQKAAEKKYGAQNVTTIGSSLGGYLAEEFGQNSKEVITVSKPTTPWDVITGKKKGEKQHDIRTTLDPIATLQNFQKGDRDIVIPSQTFNPIEEHLGTKVVDRLPKDQMIGEGIFFEGQTPTTNGMREISDLEGLASSVIPFIRDYWDIIGPLSLGAAGLYVIHKLGLPKKALVNVKKLIKQMKGELKGSGTDINFTKMKVIELKSFIKNNRRRKGMKASMYKINGKKKSELVNMAVEIYAKLNEK